MLSLCLLPEAFRIWGVKEKAELVGGPQSSRGKDVVWLPRRKLKPLHALLGVPDRVVGPQYQALYLPDPVWGIVTPWTGFYATVRETLFGLGPQEHDS